MPPGSAGARVEVLSDGVRQVRQFDVHTQLGSGTQDELHVGLPSDSPVDVRVYWLPGNEQLLEGIEPPARHVPRTCSPNAICHSGTNEPRSIPSDKRLTPSVEVANVGRQLVDGQTLQLQILLQDMVVHEERVALPSIGIGERGRVFLARVHSPTRRSLRVRLYVEW